MKRINNIWLLIIILLKINIACRNSDNNPPDTISNAFIKVNMSGTSFEEINNIENRALKNDMEISKQIYFSLDQDYILSIKLSPRLTSLSSSLSSKADTEQNNLPANIKYKLIVFDLNGNYITERNYTYRQEANTPALNLDGGSSYIFIAYSIGSTSELPEVQYADSQNKTLASATLPSVNGNTDLMYFKKEMKVIGNQENNLDIILKHKFSEISTKVDASATGFSISAINASINSHYPLSDIKLSDGEITYIGSVGNADISFSGINTSVVTGTPRIINGNTTTGSFIISSMTINNITRTDLIPLNNVKIVPGVKYNLNITLIPNDGALSYMGRLAMRVGGQIWMRHNLGADTSLNPDQSPSVRGLIGNYYQYGRPNVVATVDTPNGAISGWNTTAAPDNSWNKGTDTNPLKNATNDPCPEGWRIPTRSEIQHLIDNSTKANIGNWTNSSTANTIGPAKVFTSKTNKNAILTFPATGYHTADDGTLGWRGGSGIYWSSIVSNNNITRLSILQNDVYISTGSGSQPENIGKTSGYTIRCIAE
ncbi:hypothetical protein CMT19_16670 [Elizabethkingia anophelis]|nr:hypothetical protein [Elizabethkingia anophelis]